ncbi:MAG: RNA recognition motif domain-containing protein [Elusimicrobiota bacterium]
MQASKLYVGNLNYDAKEKQLKEIFADMGEINEIIIIKDKFTGRSKGFGFIEFKDSESAQKAIDELDGQEFLGRELRVSPAKPKRNDSR